MFYAQINSDGVCVCVSTLGGVIEDASLIPLDSYDVSILGKHWNGSGWDEIDAEPMELEEDSQLALLEGLADLFEEVEAAKSAQMDVMDALADIYSAMEGGE